MKNITQALKVVTLALTLSFGISYVYAWTAPTVTPPGGNVSAPINTSATAQYKDGSLGVGGLLKGYGNIQAVTKVESPQYCIGASCITSWPTGGGVTPPAGSEFLNTSATAQTKAGWLKAVGGNGGDLASRIGVGNNWWMSENTNGNYAIHRNGVGDKLTMDTNGNVGIGAATPGAKLEVNGNTLIDGELSGAGTYGVTRIWADTLGSKFSGDPLELQYAVAGDVVVSGTDSNLKVEGTGNSSFGGSVTAAGNIQGQHIKFPGVGGDSGAGADYYGIYQESGPWSYPYPDLRIQYHTGIKYDAHQNYGGHQFYTGYDGSGTPAGLQMQITDKVYVSTDVCTTAGKCLSAGGSSSGRVVASSGVYSVSCPAGTFVRGGGVKCAGLTQHIYESYPWGNGWAGMCATSVSSYYAGSVWAICE